jgi:hypothetical protein
MTTFAPPDKVVQTGPSLWDGPGEVLGVDGMEVKVEYAILGVVKIAMIHAWRLRKVGK